MGRTVEDNVKQIFELYKNYGESQYIGELVSKTSHSLQCGMLAEEEGFSTEIILGAFFHDVGHLVGQAEGLEPMITDGVNYGAQDHDILGENYLKDFGFPSAVTDFVRGHVNAKRYLVLTDKDYYDRLSPASKNTLVHQGGPMSVEEARTFEKSDQFEAILRMRTWDERAKVVDIQLDPLEKFEDMCRQYLLSL